MGPKNKLSPRPPLKCLYQSMKVYSGLDVSIFPLFLRFSVYFINLQLQYSQRHTMINHGDRRVTLLSDTDTVQSETYHDKSL